MNKSHEYYLNLAAMHSENSIDPSTQTGCVIVRNGEILTKGFNHIPHSITEYWQQREMKMKLVVHAEIHAIINARQSLDGSTAYVHPFLPCGNCCAAMVSAGVSRIVAPGIDRTTDRYKRWQIDFEIVRAYTERAGIELIEIYGENIQA
jgi:dCMP deaminase